MKKFFRQLSQQQEQNQRKRLPDLKRTNSVEIFDAFDRQDLNEVHSILSRGCDVNQIYLGK